MGKVLVTAALPYANANIHLGHLRSTYIPSDIYARYRRLRGDQVVYVCATDEHGTPIAVRAEREGVSPKEIVDRYYEAILNDLRSMGCSFDNFGRTTLPVHHALTQDFFTHLLEDGYIYKAKHEQLFCRECGRFLPDRYVEGRCPHCTEDARGDQCEMCGRFLKPIDLMDPHCVTCKTTPEMRQTEHWFFKLSAFREFLERWLVDNDGLTSNVKNYALQWLREDVRDWCITRDMAWGVPVPIENVDGKVIYVWFDAPIGYISTTIEWARLTGRPDGWKDFWTDDESQLVHFIGKDIIYHHAIFWPAMLKARGMYSLPSKIVAGEYLTLEGKKMSKSRGWSVEVSEYLEDFEPDPLRYYLAVVSPLGKDADFRWDEYVRRNNNELADILGNFIHRTLTFTVRYFERIPEPAEMNEGDVDVLQSIARTKGAVETALDTHEFHQALRHILNLAAIGNKYLSDKEPWKTIKRERNEAATTLYVANQIIRALAIMLAPFLPFTAEKLWHMLNLSGSVHEQNWDSISDELASGHEINLPEPLFQKLDNATMSKAG